MSFTNTSTGRPAWTGPNGEPGTASPTVHNGVSYTTPYIMPDGRVAYYAPGTRADPGNTGALLNAGIDPGVSARYPDGVPEPKHQVLGPNDVEEPDGTITSTVNGKKVNFNPWTDTPQSAAEKAAAKGLGYAQQVRLLFPFIPEELVNVFATSWAEYGSTELAVAQMRQDPQYDNFFPGNKRPDGTLRMTEQEYLSTVEGYKRRLGQFNVPVDQVLTPEKRRALIEGEVSPEEFGQRINTAYTRVASNIEAVRGYFAQQYGAGNLSDAALFASALNPDQSPLEYERTIRTAEIGGEAALRGFDIDLGEAERLASFGLEQQAARRLFGQAQTQLPRLNQLLTRFNDPDDEVTLDEFADAIVINDPDQLSQFARLFGRSSSSFSRQGGVEGDRTGLSGLRAR